MDGMTKEKQTVIDWVKENEGRLSDFHQKIWHYAEPAFREYESAKSYCELLKAEGFQVEEGSGEMPTAFLATFGDGKPVLASYAEYDCTPGNSQKAAPYEAVRDGVHRWAAGHTDPHSALGVGALAGILSAKAAMQKHNLKGTLKFFGEPAEKVCGSKPVHAAKGYYDDIDATISYHPTYRPIGNTVVWDTQSGSYWSVLFTFECIEPETWCSPELLVDPEMPHAAPRCPGALDAVCMMYTVTKSNKEAMYPHTGTWTLNEYIMVAGQCTSDNLPPRIGQIQYAWRSPSLAIQNQIYRVLENNAKHVAEINHCRLGIRWITKTRVGLPNRAMAELVFKNMELVGPPKFGEEARKIAKEIQKNCGLEPMEEPFNDLCERLVTPQEGEASKRKMLPPWQKNYTSDDYVDYTWHAPTARVYTSRAHLKSPSIDYNYPMWVFNAMGGIPALIDPTIFMTGRTLGTSFVELLTTPEALKKAQDEFKEKTGGGIGGSKWVPPLLPADFDPPVDLRWPEYITTDRGREWWIPNPTGKDSG
jgi:aminobenzoyl-glutamate utilization protein B